MTDIQTPTAAASGKRLGTLPVLNTPPLLRGAAAAPFRFEVPVRHKVSFWTAAGMFFLATAIIILVAYRGTPAGTTMGLSFVSIILEALPFVMLGSLLGGLFEVFIPREWIVRLLPERKIYAILVAAGLGLLLPVCECAVIPFTRRLVRKGVPFSTAVAYLLAGPIVNILVASATLMAYAWNWHVLAARMAFGYIVAVVVALIIDRWFPGHAALIDPSFSTTAGPACGHDHDQDSSCDHDHDHDHAHSHDHGHDHEHAHAEHDHAHAGDDHAHEHHDHDHDHGHSHVATVRQPIWGRLAEAVNHAGDDFLQVGQFLVLGAFVASICQTLIPRHAFLAVSHAPVLAIMIMMGMAVVLNLCSGADAFVAASFRNALPMSAQLGFMVLGPMLDLKLSAMYLSFIKKKAFLALVVLMYSSVLVLMIGYQYYPAVTGWLHAHA
jgi:uncharacterized membrane protein YraQ (UPF0718 family)